MVMMTSFRRVKKINERIEKTRTYLMFPEEMINSSLLLTLHKFRSVGEVAVTLW
jgi:hypothetical protein